jgi:hypothetical protein
MESVYLRSRAVCSTLSGILALFSNIATRRVRPSTSTSSAVVLVGVAMAFNVFHGLIIIVIPPTIIVIVLNGGELAGDIDFLALQKPVHDIANL